MSEQDVKTLNRAIKQLNKRRDELEDLSYSAPLRRRDEIYDLMDLVNIRIGWLRTTKNHLSAAIVKVDKPKADDRTQINDALAALSTSIASDQKLSVSIKLARNVLVAARRIKNNINGRQNPMNA